MNIPANADTSSSQSVACDRCRDENEGSVTGGRNGAVYDLNLPSSYWWPISEDVDKLPAERQLGQLSADGSPYIGLDGFQEPKEARGPFHGLNVGSGFVEFMLDTDSSATNAAPGRIDFSPISPCQNAADRRRIRSAGEVLECITQLCELNGALCQYHAPVTATKLRVGDASQPTPPHLAPYECFNDEMDEMDSFDLSTLQIGQLLSLTSQLGTINARLGTQGSGTCASSRDGIPRSMASGETYSSALEQAAHHLVVGCYYRLECIFSHVLKMLHRARDRPSLFRASTLLQTGTPLLSIDGFALDGDRDMQLDLTMHACEQVLCTTRRSVLPCEPR